MSVPFERFINTSIPFQDRFVKIFNFSDEQSTQLANGIYNKDGFKCFFNDSGAIIVKKDNEPSVLDWKLPIALPSESRIEFPSGTNQVLAKNTSQKWFMSRSKGSWILYNNNDKFVLLYNPIARQEFADFYKSKPGEAKGILVEYCQKTGLADNVCKCINYENKELNISGEDENAQFCMNNLFGNNTNRKYIKESNRNEYDSISSQCHCVNQECPNDHPLTNALRDIVKCLGVNISICNTTLDAGRDFKSQNIDIVQQCGINRNSKPSEDTSKPSEDTPKPSDDTPKPSEDAPKSNSMMYIIIAIVILLILAGVFFMKR
jgi:hypothetical protein